MNASPRCEEISDAIIARVPERDAGPGRHAVRERGQEILVDDAVALRGLFLIDPRGIVRHAVINDLPLGRSVTEALRMVDALQFVETHGDQVCPANWQEGQEAMKPTAAGVADYLAKHAKK